MIISHGPGCARQVGTQITFSDLEMLAFLFVPLAMLERQPFDTAKALEALARADALIVGLQRDKEYETYRDAFVRGLAHLAAFPGGVSFGRLHFEDR